MADDPTLTIPKEMPLAGEADPESIEPLGPRPHVKKLPKVNGTYEPAEHDIPYFGF